MVLARLVTLFLLIIALPAIASNQLNLLTKNQASAEATAPNPFSLLGEWWKYVDISHENLEERVSYVKKETQNTILSTSPETQKELTNIGQQINSYLDGLVELKVAKSKLEKKVLQEIQNYTLDEIQLLFNEYHQLNTNKDRLINIQIEEASRAKKSEQIISETIIPYRDIKENTDTKLKLGLIVMAHRLNWFVWKSGTPIHQDKIDQITEQLDFVQQEVSTFTEKLLVDEKALRSINQKIDQQSIITEKLHEKTLAAKEAYTDKIGIDFKSRLEERLYAQRVVATEVEHSRSRVELSLLHSLKSLAHLKYEDKLKKEIDHIEQLQKTKSISSEVLSQIASWKNEIEKERVAIQELISGGHLEEDEHEIRSIVDERITAMKLTAQEIAKTEKSLFNVAQVQKLLEKQLGKSHGLLFKLRNSGLFLFDQTFLRLWDLLNSKLFELGDVPVTSWDIIQAILIIIFTFFIARLFQRSLLRLNTSSDGKIPPAIYTLSRVIFYTIIVLGGFAAFASIGVNFTNIAIVAGALSVGIGFGLQSVVNNFVSGIIILFEHNIKIGDFIELDSGLKGTVRDINVRSTIVNTLDNLDIIVPNSELVTAKVTNYTLNEPIVRIHVPFGVAYGSDKEIVRAAVLEAAKNVDITYDDGANRRTQVWLVGFGDSSLNFELVVWLNPKLGRAAPGSWRALFSWEIETALRKYNIEIPFPQRDLHLKSGFKPAID